MNLKELRKAKGLTQQSLADAAGVNISQVQKLESGEINVGNITLKNGLALANALGVDPAVLLLASPPASGGIG